jgi:hypothetical protein
VVRQSLGHDTRSSAPTRAREPRGGRPAAWVPLNLIAVSGAAYGLFLLLPYYVNDLDRFALDEVASGAHDATELWPYQDGGLSSVVWAYGSAFAVMVAPFLTLGSTLWAATVMWRDRRVLEARAWGALVGAVVIGTALIAYLGSPLHGALIEWWLD